MTGLDIDFETRSAVDLKAVGAYAYFEHPTTEVMLASYAIDDGPVKRWRIGEPCPAEVRAHIEAGGRVYAHSAGFERLALREVLGPRHGWPVPRLEQYHCVAATAAALSLPRDLDRACRALGLPFQKDDEGHRLMLRMCKPRKARKGEDPNVLHWYGWNDPALVERLHVYCDADVRAARAARRRMMPLSDDMQNFYWISERINDRGVRVDRASAMAALELADKAKRIVDAELAQVTGGAVRSATQVEALKSWIAGRGVALASAGKADIEDLLFTDDVPDDVRRALELRQEGGKTSVSKLDAFLARCNLDGRARGAFIFHAAGPGRFSSRGVQLHNMPRYRKVFEDAELDQATLFKAIRSGEPNVLRAFYGDTLGRPSWLLSDAIRGFLWAAPGHDLVVSDYSSIEGRVAAWLAGEDWKVEAYRKLDQGEGHGIYELAAAGIFGTTPEVIAKDKPKRQIGKVSELSLGYEGGVGAFYSMTKNYNLKLDSVYAPVWASAPEDRRAAAERRYEECCKRGEVTTQVLSRNAWLASELIKVGWRLTHPAIKEAWKLLKDATFRAVENPGLVVHCLKLQFVVRDGFLWLRLPSGRCLAYGAPAIRSMIAPWADKTKPMRERETQPTVTVCGVDAVTQQWVRYGLYGGIIFENAVQAIAFDVLKNGIEKAEAAGYPVILHVHDEPGSEVLRGFGDVDEYSRLICDLSGKPWAAGLPIAASGWRGKRYRK